MVYTFHLRPDVRWSDGSCVTADDYVYAWRTALDPRLGSETATLLYPLRNAEAVHVGRKPASALGARAESAYVLRVDLQRPRADLLDRMATSLVYAPVPQRQVERFGARWTEPGRIQSNGPYVLSSWKPRERIELLPNQFYWRGRPGFKRISILLLGDPASQAITMFEAGDLDYAQVPGSDLVRVRNSGLASLLRRVLVPRLYALAVDTRARPLDDIRVRRALSLAIDRAAMGTISNGQLTPAERMIPPGVPGHSSTPIEYDPAAARRLLAQAGFSEPRSFPRLSLVIRNTPVEMLQGEALQAMLRQELGVNLRIEALEAGAFRSFVDAMREGRGYQLTLVSATADVPDPWLFHNLMIGHRGRGAYPTYWSNPLYERLLDRADHASNRGERERLFKALDAAAAGGMPLIPLTSETLSYVARPDVRGLFIPYGSLSPSLIRAWPAAATHGSIG
jgi:ABC-type oligopeptide transport system substrate-binding subunit